MIDLNCDMGEGVAGEEAIMPYLTSANIACGGHAGDEETMRGTILQAMRWGLAIGAHPGYVDRENFGRRELDLPSEEVARVVYEQCVRFGKIAGECGASVVHVKAHGALYNQAVRDGRIAAAIAEGVARWRRGVVLMGLAGSAMLDVFRRAGFRVYAEAFADRTYEADGTLRSRQLPDALIHDPQVAAAQALRIAAGGGADTLCIHGDTPGAAEIAREVASLLRGEGYLYR